MNSDEGTYEPCNHYDQLIQKASSDDKIWARSRSAIANILIGCEIPCAAENSECGFSRELIIYFTDLYDTG